ncbi:MAG: transposase [Muribaculaceae bacterium]|nr:transposase [Muribaculaceae bacterium]
MSESVKGVDGFKKIKGIKRHLIIDRQGNILHVHTTCANINDGKACLEIIAEVKRKYPSLKEIRGDMGYRGGDVIRTAREHGMDIVCTKSNADGATFVPV